MENFFLDNDDIMFQFKHLDLDRIILLKEDHFKDKDEYDYSPVDIADAKDSYNRVLEIVGDLAANFIEPRAAEVDEEGTHYENGDVRYATGIKEDIDILSKADLMGFTLPRKYGGLNLPITIYSIAIEIVSRADASLMNIFGLQDIAETINEFASENIKQDFLPRFCSGEVTGSMALTEPEAGSDLQNVQLKAHLGDDGQWYLNGVKRFITNGCGQISLVLARSEDGTKDGRGLSMFIYERDENMKIRRIEDKMGIHGSPTCELQFNNARAILVGQRKRGLIKYVMSLMNGARLAIAAQALGIAEAAYHEADKYAKERIQFGVAIRTMQQVSGLLLDMRMKIEAARALLYETSMIVDIKKSLEHMMEVYPERKSELRDDIKMYTKFADMFTPMVKAYSTEIANQVCDDSIQIHGGTGFMRDFNVERHFRDARITNIYEGTTQLQVVAAIGGVMTGIWQIRINQYLEEDFSRFTEILNKLKHAQTKLEKAIATVKEVDNKQFEECHARSLVDMATEIIISYLLLKQAKLSQRKEIMTRLFIDRTEANVERGVKMIMESSPDDIEQKYMVLDNKN